MHFAYARTWEHEISFCTHSLSQKSHLKSECIVNASGASAANQKRNMFPVLNLAAEQVLDLDGRSMFFFAFKGSKSNQLAWQVQNNSSAASNVWNVSRYESIKD